MLLGLCNRYIFAEYIIPCANRSVFVREVLVVWNEKKSKGKEAVYTLHKRKVLVPIWSMMDYTAARVKKIYIHRINYHNIVSNAHIRCAFGTFYISTYPSIRQSIKFLGPQCFLFMTYILFVTCSFYSF